MRSRSIFDPADPRCSALASLRVALRCPLRLARWRLILGVGISIRLIGKALVPFRGRIQLRKDSALSLGVPRPLGLGIRARQAKVHPRIVRREFARRLKFRDRGLDLPQFQQCATQKFMRSGRLRVEFHGVSGGAHGLIRAMLLQRNRGHELMRESASGVDSDFFAQL